MIIVPPAVTYVLHNYVVTYIRTFTLCMEDWVKT